jgi:hypothetical protein
VPIQVLGGCPVQVLTRGVPNSGPRGGPIQVLEGCPFGSKGGPSSGPRVPNSGPRGVPIRVIGGAQFRF